MLHSLALYEIDASLKVSKVSNKLSASRLQLWADTQTTITRNVARLTTRKETVHYKGGRVLLINTPSLLGITTAETAHFTKNLLIIETDRSN